MEEGREAAQSQPCADAGTHIPRSPDAQRSDGGHTPGPWDYVPSTEHHGPYVTSDYGCTIADCYVMSRPGEASTRNGGPSRPIHHMHEMADANARLIAAAPELLEALKEAASMLAGATSCFNPGSPADGEWATVRDLVVGQARNAIAKATKAEA